MCLSYSADMAKIDWPHLTHLNMRYIGNMAMLIDVLPMIPDLVCLTVEMNFTQSGQLQESIDALSTLRTRYPVPIKSNVRILIVHAWRCEKFDEFSFAAQNIKLILPNLKSFGVFSTS
ncbi:hypothetical protein IWW51_001343 [Coemansia sp. RSA 2702]|nr:hypothetical protein IWW54_000872 [Coemansia sp. RSA 2705]KAJ2328168.1 hypothetical protein IWW51_001343 [Coemansia sp. RSA 2702]KAJ2735251.1 hypothetical protein H4R23_002241 [Coemansia sp. Cherry 401B]